MKVYVEDVKTIRNANGVLFEPLNDTELGEQGNVHLTWTLPGCVRGNHYHEKGTEIITAYGATLVRYIEDGVVHDVQVGAEEVKRFTFPPGVPHAFKNTGTTPSVQIAFNTEIHDPALPDTFKTVVIEL